MTICHKIVQTWKWFLLTAYGILVRAFQRYPNVPSWTPLCLLLYVYRSNTVPYDRRFSCLVYRVNFVYCYIYFIFCTIYTYKYFAFDGVCPGAVFLPASIAYLIGTNLFGPLAHKIGRWGLWRYLPFSYGYILMSGKYRVRAWMAWLTWIYSNAIRSALGAWLRSVCSLIITDSTAQ